MLICRWSTEVLFGHCCFEHWTLGETRDKNQRCQNQIAKIGYYVTGNGQRAVETIFGIGYLGQSIVCGDKTRGVITKFQTRPMTLQRTSTNNCTILQGANWNNRRLEFLLKSEWRCLQLCMFTRPLSCGSFCTSSQAGNLRMHLKMHSGEKSNATCVIMHPLMQVLWRGIWKHTVEKNLTNAISAVWL